jgi:hypothetical protein
MMFSVLVKLAKIKHFIGFHGKRHYADLIAAEVEIITHHIDADTCDRGQASSSANIGYDR